MILCIFPCSGSSTLGGTTGRIVVTSTAGRRVVLKFDNSVRETPANFSDVSFKICEAGVEVIGVGENDIGGGNKCVEIIEDAGFKIGLWLLPRRFGRLPRKWRLLPRKLTLRPGSVV